MQSNEHQMAQDIDFNDIQQLKYSIVKPFFVQQQPAYRQISQIIVGISILTTVLVF